MKNIRSYELKLFGSKSKFEDLRYTSYSFRSYVNTISEHLYFKPWIKFYSTKNMGNLFNQAQRRATGMVSSKITNEKENGHALSCPQLKELLCVGKVVKQSHKHFNYKISLGLSWGDERAKSRFLFAKGTSPLKKALQQGWVLSNQCEPFYSPFDNQWYVRIFVSRPVVKVEPKKKSIGIDVGINHIVATSEGYLGNSLSKRLKKLNVSRQERQRQFSLAKRRLALAKTEEEKAKYQSQVDLLSKNLTKNKRIKKTVIKQLLDREAKRIIARGLSACSNLVVEDPRVLANLKGAISLVRWTRTYFADRLQVLGKEYGVNVVLVHPAYTSIICSGCGEQDRTNRQGVNFECGSCKSIQHADLNAAVNLSRKGQDFVDIYKLKIKKPGEDLFRFIPKSAAEAPSVAIDPLIRGSF